MYNSLVYTQLLLTLYKSYIRLKKTRLINDVIT